jgi:3-deoxy-manno-octulosonate cytidylyltransferase (CMP-KDO synthetase)
MKSAIVIPARLASTRFPEKMLADVGGTTLIRKVYDQCLLTGFDVYVVTDSERISSQVPNALIEMEAENGTTRIAKILDRLPYYQCIINVQGDMVTVPVDGVKKLPELLAKHDVATLRHDMTIEQQSDPNTVKVIHTGEKAHWFCRSPLSYGSWHYGIYAYHPSHLKKYPYLKQYQEELSESLEQLRWLQNGYTIGVIDSEPAAEINTKADLENYLKNL